MSDGNVVKADDLGNIFKNSTNLYELNELSFNCYFDNDDDCFDEYKENTFPSLKKLSISCIIIIIIFINI